MGTRHGTPFHKGGGGGRWQLLAGANFSPLGDVLYEYGDDK
jgi:hypothetical protein